MTSPLRNETEREEDQPVQPRSELREEKSTPALEEQSEAQTKRPVLVRSELGTANQDDTNRPATPAKQATGISGESSAQETALFPTGALRELQQRWDQIQAGFVDQPRAAVHDAETLVSSAMERLADVFAQERSRLEQQWSTGNDVSTEDLRMAFQRYRSFFRRVLSI